MIEYAKHLQKFCHDATILHALSKSSSWKDGWWSFINFRLFRRTNIEVKSDEDPSGGDHFFACPNTHFFYKRHVYTGAGKLKKF